MPKKSTVFINRAHLVTLPITAYGRTEGGARTLPIAASITVSTMIRTTASESVPINGSIMTYLPAIKRRNSDSERCDHERSYRMC